ncbi:Structural maintenance of chromosomes protein 5 [Balamuthia mandrillaris]
MMLKLNVQVDNLCQFLPQDKVSSFAAMSPPELLKETEKAVGTKEMVQSHEALIRMKSESKSLERACAEHAEHLQALKRKNETLERDVLRFREFEKHQKRAQQLNMKIPWIRFDNERNRAIELREVWEAAKEKFALREKELQPLKQRITEKENEVKQMAQKNARLKESAQRLDVQRKQKGEELEELADRIVQQEDELETLSNREKERKVKIKKMEEEIAKYEAELQAAVEQADTQEQEMNSKNDRLRELAELISQIQSQQMELKEESRRRMGTIRQLQKEVQELDDVKKQRMEMLRRYSRDCYSAAVWLDNNRDKFEKPVYGPLALEVNVPDALHACYLEQATPSWLLTSFVCESAKDHNTILEEVYRKQKLRINAIRSDTYDPRRFQPPLDKSDLRGVGITHWLHEVFEAPSVVKAAICENAGVHQIAAGTNETARHMESLLRDVRQLRNIFTPESQYIVTFSHYGGGASTRVVPVKKANFFGEMDSPQRKAELEEQLRLERKAQADVEAKYRELEQQEKQHRREQGEINKAKQQINEVRKEIQTLKMRIKSRQTTLQGLSVEEDTATQERKIHEVIFATNRARVHAVLQIQELTKKILAQVMEKDKLVLLHAQEESILQRLKTEYMQSNHEFAALRRAVEASEAHFKEAKQNASRLKEKAEAVVQLTPEVKELFQSLPDTVEELEAAATDAKARADLSYQTNPRIIEEYEERCKEIEELEAKLATEQEDLRNETGRIERLKETWLPPLKDLLARINESFGKYFSEIGCAGEVVLEENEDFAKYGVVIKVKFRNKDTLHQLNAHLQSGGERSVSTMLYLVALQDLTECPFRLVDEINQGMDPRNERMIFQQVVDVACRPGLPQYFLITPKLLHDLNFTPEITVLCVFNGPWQLPQDKWNLESLLINGRP